VNVRGQVKWVDLNDGKTHAYEVDGQDWCTAIHGAEIAAAKIKREHPLAQITLVKLGEPGRAKGAGRR